MVTEPTTLPCDDGARLDEDENIPPSRPSPGQPCPQEAVSEAGSGSSLATLMDGELVALGEHLELEGGSRSDASAK